MITRRCGCPVADAEGEFSLNLVEGEGHERVRDLRREETRLRLGDLPLVAFWPSSRTTISSFFTSFTLQGRLQLAVYLAASWPPAACLAASKAPW